MAQRNVSLVRRRQLARILRELRETADRSIEEAARHLEFSPAKLSRIENALQAVDIHTVKSMLDLYDAGGARWTECLDLARAARQKGWWRAYGLNDTGYVPLEAEASVVWDYTLGYVPGLLQTEAYARVIFGNALRPWGPGELDNAVRARMFRQKRLTDPEHPLELTAILDESVLLRPLGGPAVLRAQLEHLLEAAGLPRVTLQVLPLDAGVTAGLTGTFTILEFGDLGEPDLAYVDHACRAVHVEKAEDVARAKLRFDRLRSEALSPAASVALIERVAAEYRPE